MVRNNKEESPFLDGRDDEKKKKKKRILWLLLLLLLLFGGGAGYLLTQHHDSVRKHRVVAGSFLPNKKDASKLTDEEVSKYAQTAVDASKFQMIINPDINVDSKSLDSDMTIENPNNNAYPIAVTVKLSDGKLVYSSGAIDVGYGVKNAKLDKSLKAGNYSGIATFKIYDAKTSKEKGTVSTAVKFIVR